MIKTQLHTWKIHIKETFIKITATICNICRLYMGRLPVGKLPWGYLSLGKITIIWTEIASILKWVMYSNLSLDIFLLN